MVEQIVMGMLALVINMSMCNLKSRIRLNITREFISNNRSKKEQIVMIRLIPRFMPKVIGHNINQNNLELFIMRLRQALKFKVLP